MPALYNELGSLALAFFLRNLQVICELFLEYLVEFSAKTIRQWALLEGRILMTTILLGVVGLFKLFV